MAKQKETSSFFDDNDAIINIIIVKIIHKA